RPVPVVGRGLGLEPDAHTPASQLALPVALLIGVRKRLALAEPRRREEHGSPHAQVRRRMIGYIPGLRPRVDEVPTAVVIAAGTHRQSRWQVHRATNDPLPSVMCVEYSL